MWNILIWFSRIAGTSEESYGSAAGRSSDAGGDDRWEDAEQAWTSGKRTGH